MAFNERYEAILVILLQKYLDRLVIFLMVVIQTGLLSKHSWILRIHRESFIDSLNCLFKSRQFPQCFSPAQMGFSVRRVNRQCRLKGFQGFVILLLLQKEAGTQVQK